MLAADALPEQRPQHQFRQQLALWPAPLAAGEFWIANGQPWRAINEPRVIAARAGRSSTTVAALLALGCQGGRCSGPRGVQRVANGWGEVWEC